MTAEILVVDDVPFMRDLLKLHLSNAGYRVKTAEDALVAGRRVLESVPDLIITDVSMPYMDGIEFVSALRADKSIPDIPVIFLTSRTDIEDDARRLRAAAYFTKPVDAARLLKAIALHVRM